MPLSMEFNIPRKSKVNFLKKEDWSDFKFCLQAVKQDGLNLKHIENQTEELCLIAVRNYPQALYYVKNQTESICLGAVKNHPSSLQFVKEQTPELCLTAVKQNGCTLQYVKEQTPEICLAAVRQDGYALQYVKEQTPEICLEAVKQNGRTLQFVKEQTLEIIQVAVIQNPRSVNFINVLPVSNWDAEWFKYIENVELKRKFIKERGVEVFQQLNPVAIDENEEYCLIEYKLGKNISKTLLFRCPSSNDLYFQEIDPEINDLENALRFLNNNISKEELAYES